MTQEGQFSKNEIAVREWLSTVGELPTDSNDLMIQLPVGDKRYRLDVAVITGGIIFLAWLGTVIKQEDMHEMSHVILSANWQMPYCSFEISPVTQSILLKSYIVLEDDEEVSREILAKHLAWIGLSLTQYPPILDAVAKKVIDVSTAVKKIEESMPK
ncbi:hypothetical protein ACIP1U_03110 [Cupriavidus sp. NPDC089707]|uniref:hypothetical protein n=1 Tax=Cupriavidus sp. NPDC089707 TaxID=3363963 RepID=UPI003800250D